ncbi:MAG TPA: 3'-5' exonuclease, partial [Polyangiaceae bacterium]|nr:3'-5' exonuclease [Polyangiaceae bacterium]
VFDFDDLLLCTERLLSQFADVRHAEAARFDHVMIDEYQDTNASQYRIIKALTQKHRNLCVVGDDDQSIYGWRGAEVTHILNFKKDWPDALVVRLEMNYRSRAPILDLANTLIANNGTRHSKVLRPFRQGGAAPRFIRFEDETAEATAIVREISQQSSREDEERVPLNHFAILFRTNEQPRAFELEMRREKLRYVLVGGQSFFDRKEVRDILAYLKVLANPEDEVSLLRIINTPSRGIGSGTLKALVDVAVSSGTSLWNVLPSAAAQLELQAAMRERLAGFTQLVERYRARVGREPLSQLLRALILETEYKQELERLYKTPAEVDARWNSVEGVVRSVEEYEAREEQPSLPGFLEDTVLGGRDDFADDREKKQYAVTLMTLHSAKGLEFPHVYMIGMEEGLLPHRRVIAEGNGVEEERRLCYVGVTRAEETLTLSMCKSRTKWGKARPSIPSRFLMEMRGEREKAARAAEAAEALVHRELQAAAAAELAGGKTSGKAGGDGAGKKARRAPRGAATPAPSVGAERKAAGAPAGGPAAPARPLAIPAARPTLASRPSVAVEAPATPSRRVGPRAAAAPPPGPPAAPARATSVVPVRDAPHQPGPSTGAGGVRPVTGSAGPSRPLPRRPEPSADAHPDGRQPPTPKRPIGVVPRS